MEEPRLFFILLVGKTEKGENICFPHQCIASSLQEALLSGVDFVKKSSYPQYKSVMKQAEGLQIHRYYAYSLQEVRGNFSEFKKQKSSVLTVR